MGQFPMSPIGLLQQKMSLFRRDCTQCFVKRDCAQEPTNAVGILGSIREAGIANCLVPVGRLRGERCL